MNDSNETLPVFKATQLPGGITEHELIDVRMPLKERRILAQRVPVILKTTHHLPKKDTDAVGWTQMDEPGKQIHTLRTKVANAGRIGKGAPEMTSGFARYFSAKENNENGKDLLKWSVEANSSHVKKKGTTYDSTWTKQPTNGDKNGQGGCIQLGAVARKHDENVRRTNQLVAQSASFLVKQSIKDFRESHSGIREQRYYSEAATTVGDEDNESISKIQWNYCRAGTNLEEALVMVGTIHIDGNDDRTHFTVLLFLDNLPRDWYPGRFLITSVKLMCTTSWGSALVFTGTHPHFALAMGPYPKDLSLDSPLRYKDPVGIQRPILGPEYPPSRLAIVAYPKEIFMRSRASYLRPEIFADQAISCYGTMRNKQEWAVRNLVRNISGPGCPPLYIDRVTRLFDWEDENGETQYPRRERTPKAIRACAQPIQPGIDLDKAVGFFTVGSEFPNKQKPVGFQGGSDKCGVVEWTHVSQTVQFDYSIDEIPANQDWRHEDAIRSRHFITARIKRAELEGRKVNDEDMQVANVVRKRSGALG